MSLGDLGFGVYAFAYGAREFGATGLYTLGSTGFRVWSLIMVLVDLLTPCWGAIVRTHSLLVWVGGGGGGAKQPDMRAKYPMFTRSIMTPEPVASQGAGACGIGIIVA